jgi:transposase
MEPSLKRTIAATYLAEGRLSCRKIAAAVGISARHLYTWRKDPEFQKMIADSAERFRQHLGLAEKREVMTVPQSEAGILAGAPQINIEFIGGKRRD